DDSTMVDREVYYDYFFGNTGEGPHPDDIVEEDQYDVDVSWNYSSWYVPGSNSTNYLQYESDYATRLGSISNLDSTFLSIHERMPEFRWLYVAFEDDMFINYPGSIVGDTDTIRNSVNNRWYPTTDDAGWYPAIRKGNGSMVIDGPYYDPIDGVLTISIGKAIYFGNGTNIGIIAGDITIDEIKSKIINVRVLETGYAGLITADGGIVAHPEVENSDYAGFETQPPLRLFESNADPFSFAITETQMALIQSGNTGYIEYTRDGESLILAYTSVGIGGYICIIIVPIDEVQAAIPELENRILSANDQATSFIIMITVAGIFIAGIVAVVIANQITGPLEYLMDLAMRNVSAMIKQEKLDTDDLQVDTSYTGQDDEIGDLARAFQGMLDSIRDDEPQ
ncbi:MAG: cache domain-containing protein, partial [Candidatus Thorarchaeota archaeon]